MEINILEIVPNPVARIFLNYDIHNAWLDKKVDRNLSLMSQALL